MCFPPRRFLALLALCFGLFTASAAQAQVFISEFLADNQVNSKVDEDGDHSDWIEIWNSGAAPVSLNGWYVTDDANDLRKWQFPVTTPAVTLAAGGRLLIFASSKDRRLALTKLHTNFRLDKGGEYLGLVRPDGLTVEHAYGPTYPVQIQDISYGLASTINWQPLLPAGASGKAKVPLSAADLAVGWNSSANFDDSAWQQGQSGFGYDTAGTYGALIGAGGDLQAAMYNVNSNAIIRFVFDVANPGAITGLRLQMKYDDGYICYLNGTQIAQSFSTNVLQWNGQATSDRNGAFSSSFEIAGTSANAQSFLVGGQNVLAFQMLNFSNGSTQDVDNQNAPNGSRALCLPLLEGNVSTGPGTPSYLSATPGAANSLAITSLGPLITQTTNDVARPKGDATSAPIVVTTKVLPSLKPLNPTNPVNLKYKVMYAPNGNPSTDLNVVMKDDGIAPDALAGDNFYTALIPTVNVGAGKMIRWRVEARDNAGTGIATSPPFRDQTDNEQYFGTVTEDGITTSLVPILHWFVENPGLSQSEGGTTCSLFFKPIGGTKFRFYDHIPVNLHGQSSSGFPVAKKSHDFNFNEDNRFEWKAGEKEQRAVNLITTYADKSKVRDALMWESWITTKHIAAHWVQPIRVQQNGVFWGVYDLVENGDEDFLDRAGLDPNGALYKMYNNLDSASTDAEKKTRESDGNNNDLQALITGLDPAKSLLLRRQYAYDNVDIPSLVNYLATNVLLLNHDFGHKNYYVYRDTNGTGEWSVLPWDQDLSFGHTWTSVQNYFNDDINSQAGLVVGGSGNRMMNLIANSGGVAPDLTQMFLRRIRTLMDTLLMPTESPTNPLEHRMDELLDQIDPPGAAFLTDADLDLQKWGYWTDGNSASISAAGQDAATHVHGPRKQTLRLTSANPNPPYPAVQNNAEGLGDTRPAFLPGRRSKLFSPSTTLAGFAVPPSTPAALPNLVFEQIDFNPSTGTQEQEYLIIRNNSSTYVDLSGWKLTGAIEYTFRGGTVLPPFTSNSAITATGDVHNGRLHVAKNPARFRQRTTSPKGNEFRLVMGGYSGQLSARGETVQLIKPGATPEQDVVVATSSYTAAPTAAQNALRVTELSFNPAPPTAAELLALPGVQASDFEYIELANTGATPLDLSGATFDRGITFTFPANFTLQPDERCVVASLSAAFQLRYGNGPRLAGQFAGNLDNSGETIQLLDAVGENILGFQYDPLWFGVPDPTNPNALRPAQGYSLVARSSTPAWDAYDTPMTWALGGTAGGTPGSTDTTFSNAYVGWRKSFFNATEELNASVAGPGADPDGDLRSSFDEYSFGGNPKLFDGTPQQVISFVTVENQEYAAITFNRRHNALDAVYKVEASSDLVNWEIVNLPVGLPVDVGGGLERVTYRDSQPKSAGKRFLHVTSTR